MRINPDHRFGSLEIQLTAMSDNATESYNRRNYKILQGSLNDVESAVYQRVISEQPKSYKEQLTASAKDDGLVLQYANKRLQNDKEFVLLCVKQNGMALKFASDNLKSDEDVVSAAVKQNSEALQLASQPLQDKFSIKAH